MLFLLYLTLILGMLFLPYLTLFLGMLFLPYLTWLLGMLSFLALPHLWNGVDQLQILCSRNWGF